MATVFSVCVSSPRRINLTSTVSLCRMEMAVCIHFSRTWKVRPNGSGPAGNSRKFSIEFLSYYGAMTSFSKELDVGRTIARRAGEVALRYWGTGIGFESKSDQSPVTVADREGEQLIARLLEEYFPGDGMLGEEGTRKDSGNGRRWIIDPVDGTRDFVRGNPAWAVLIGFEAAGQVEAGFAFLPATDQMFYAARGAGAFRNDAPIHV